MNLLFLSLYHSEGPSSRYRLYNYLPYFESRGHSVTVKPLIYDWYVRAIFEQKRKNYARLLWGYLRRFFVLLCLSARYDALIIEKELFPFCPAFIETWLLRGKTYFIDYDDARSVAYRQSSLALFLKNKINRINAAAAATLIGNNWYRKEIPTAKQCFFLPTVTDIPPIQKSQYAIQDCLKIVWIGSPSTVAYLDSLKDVLGQLHQIQPIVLRVIGAPHSSDTFPVESISWNSATYLSHLAESDVGIMPLLNTEWENGKCGHKLTLYMSVGLPVVSTPSPANSEIIEHGKSGFIADTDVQWMDSLIALGKDQALREAMGKRARERIATHYSYEIWGPRFVEFIESIV